MKILFGPLDSARVHNEGATATTDARGHFRIDLGKFAWSKQVVRFLVLAPGYGLAQRKLEPEVLVADFEMAVEPWKETLVRLEDGSGKPVPGVEIVVSLYGMICARPQTDGQGSCRVPMAPEVWLSLSAEPQGARPIEASLGIRKDGPASVTLPVLPLIRGRVLDGEGRPVPEVAIGNWVSFYRDDQGQMIVMPYFRGEPASTDRNGNFVFPLKVMLTHNEVELPTLPHRQVLLAFADRRLQKKAYQFIDQYHLTEPLEVRLEPARRVRVPIERSLVPPITDGEMGSSLMVANRPGSSEGDFFINRDLS